MPMSGYLWVTTAGVDDEVAVFAELVVQTANGVVIS